MREEYELPENPQEKKEEAQGHSKEEVVTQ